MFYSDLATVARDIGKTETRIPHVEIFIALWLTMGFGAGLIARAKGYNFVGWFIYGFFLGFIALLHSIMIRARFESEHGF